MNPTPEPENPPAFPGANNIAGYGNVTPHTLPDGRVEWKQMNDGMTLRDCFAAKAMASIVSATVNDFKGGMKEWVECTDLTASQAYQIADAMLKARAAK